MDVFMDTEFTGNRLLQVALVGEGGEVLYNSNVNPGSLEFDQQWRITSRIHGIKPEDVKDAPPLDVVQRRVLELCSGHRVIGYAVSADSRHFPVLKQAATVVCAMKAYREIRNNKQGIKLKAALEECHIPWTFGRAHGALADAQATRALWLWIQDQRRKDVLALFDGKSGEQAPAVLSMSSLADKARQLAERFGPRSKVRQAPKIEMPNFDPAFPNKGKPWNPEDSNRVGVLWSDGVSIAEMSLKFGRTQGAIIARVVHLGLAEDAEMVKSIDANRHAILQTIDPPEPNGLAA